MERGKDWSVKQEIFHLTKYLDGSKKTQPVEYTRKELQ